MRALILTILLLAPLHVQAQGKVRCPRFITSNLTGKAIKARGNFKCYRKKKGAVKGRVLEESFSNFIHAGTCSISTTPLPITLAGTASHPAAIYTTDSFAINGTLSVAVQEQCGDITVRVRNACDDSLVGEVLATECYSTTTTGTLPLNGLFYLELIVTGAGEFSVVVG